MSLWAPLSERKARGMQSLNGLLRMVQSGGGFNLWNVYWDPCLRLAPAHTLVWGLSGRPCLEQQSLLVSKNNVNSHEKTALAVLVSYLQTKAQRFQKWDLWNKTLTNHKERRRLLTRRRWSLIEPRSGPHAATFRGLHLYFGEQSKL